MFFYKRQVTFMASGEDEKRRNNILTINQQQDQEVEVVFRIQDKDSGKIIEIGSGKRDFEGIKIIFADSMFLPEPKSLGKNITKMTVTFLGRVEFTYK